MKAQITELWDTGREILTYCDGNSSTRPQTISELKKCENVLVEKSISGYYTAIINNTCCMIIPRKAQHPSGGGTIYFIEIENYL
jgi:hypothetical protein